MPDDPVIQQAHADLDSVDLQTRLDALHRLRTRLGSDHDEAITTRLIALLRDPDTVIRRVTAEVLGKSGSRAAVQALIDTLYDDAPDVRIAAADALGELGDSAAVPPLIDALYDESFDVRFAAAEALGRLKDQRAVVDLITVLDSDDYPLAMMAARALYQIGTPEALAAIQHLREGEGDEAEYNFDVPPDAEYTLPHIPIPPAPPAPPAATQRSEPPAAEPPDFDATVRHVPSDKLKEYLEAEEANEPVPGRGAEAPAPTPNVQFSAYAPREVQPNVWQPLVAYVFVGAAASAVTDDAAQQLGDKLANYRPITRPATTRIVPGTLITATPDLPGFQFNPPSAQIAFYEDWHRFDFKLRANDAPLDQASNGRITFTVEGVIVADVPLSIYVGGSVPPQTQFTTVNAARPIYQSIFCSYSHQDTEIVARVERAYKALGLDFLRDVMTLKSGQDWNVELLHLIERADIFQLFWSPAAAQSKYVRQEWEHALSLHRQDSAFIRPVYWEQPMPAVPPELAAIHFAYAPELDD